MKPIILGGGLAGLSLANFLNKDSIVLEKEKTPGGLCRSFNFKGIFYDIGPHIIFSKGLSHSHVCLRENCVLSSGEAALQG